MFLPINSKQMKKRGWDQVDFVIVTGDAYVDHPSWGTSIISRVLENQGFKVGIIPQPDWKSADAFKEFGRPRLGFFVNSGNVDSMVNNYSVFKHKRKFDVYSPGGENGHRPDRAVTVYCNRVREAYRDIPIIIGGLEASLRRFGHYDYWDNKVRRSILMDSRADILIYGMGERATIEIAEALDSGIAAADINWIKGTTVKMKEADLYLTDDDVVLPQFEEIQADKDMYCKSFSMQYRSNDPINGKRTIEKYPGDNYVVQNPPQPPLEREELDALYALPYERNYHPSYEERGGVPAITEVKFSITANRGCFGGCGFCAITYHQGREVRSRSKESIVAEAKLIANMPDFKGYIHDVGGPTANFRNPSCKKQLEHGMCQHRDCLYPHPCSQLVADHRDYIDVLNAVRQVSGVKKVFVRSGIRYDYVMADKSDAFMNTLCKNHVSGILKVAPEHVSPGVLCNMKKPAVDVFNKFTEKYNRTNKRLGMDQYMVPYFISSHPGSTLDDAINLALYLKDTGFVPDQVQDFYPTPGTLATCMYYTEKDPFTMEPVYVAKDLEEKKMQRALMHFNKKENRSTVIKALQKAGRTDLIGVLLAGGGGHRPKGDASRTPKSHKSSNGKNTKRSKKK